MKKTVNSVIGITILIIASITSQFLLAPISLQYKALLTALSLLIVSLLLLSEHLLQITKEGEPA